MRLLAKIPDGTMTTRAIGRRRRTQWRALLRGLRYRLVIPVFRSTHSAEYTARGVANGVFWGLTPTVGLQTLEITAVWFVGKTLFERNSSLLQAYIWVWVNNPLTMVPMYYAFYVTGLVVDRPTDRGQAGMPSSSSSGLRRAPWAGGTAAWRFCAGWACRCLSGPRRTLSAGRPSVIAGP